MIISLVTPTYNSAGTVRDSIASLDSQRYGRWERIVVDGGSSDSTLAFIPEVPNQRRRWISEGDRGIYAALNKGMEMAAGGALCALHSDAMLADERVLEDVAQALSDDGMEAVYGDLEYVSRDNVARVTRRWKSGVATPAKLAWGWMDPHPTLFPKASLAAKVGQYELGCRISGDYEYSLRCLVRERAWLKYIPCVLVRMRMGGGRNGSVRALAAHGAGGLGALVWKNVSKIWQFL